MALLPKPLADLLTKAFRYPTTTAEASSLRMATAIVDWANIYLSTIATLPTFVDFETPAGAVNSTTGTDGNAVFTLAHTPTGTSLLLILDGIVQIAGVQYTLSTATITFAAGYHPTTGGILRACYRY